MCGASVIIQATINTEEINNQRPGTGILRILSRKQNRVIPNIKEGSALKGGHRSIHERGPAFSIESTTMAARSARNVATKNPVLVLNAIQAKTGNIRYMTISAPIDQVA